MIGIIGIVLGVLTLVFLSIKRVNAIICALAGALVVGIFNGMGIFDTLTQVFFPAVGANVASFMMLFFFSVEYARLISDSGCAASIAYFILDKFGAKKMILAVLLILCVLSYGGVSMFNVFFLIWPICLVLAKQANISKAIFVPVIYAGALGGFALAMPGAPSMSNVIASQMLGVSATAAPVSSIIATIVITAFSYWYLTRLQKKYIKQGRVFEEEKVKASDMAAFDRDNIPKAGSAILPMAVMIILYITLSNLNIGLNSTEAICVAMFVSSVLVVAMNLKRFQNLKASIGRGALESVSPLISLSVILAFSAVVQATQGFEIFVKAITSLSFGPYAQAILSCNVIGLITASSSGTVKLVLSTFGETWLASGVNTEVLCRVVSLSSNGLSFAPHSGGLFPVLDVSGETHKTIFIDSFIASALACFIGVLTVLALAAIGIA